MTLGHHPDREKEIFLAALELEKDARRRFVEDRCAGDTALIENILALLAASESGGVVTAGGMTGAVDLAHAQARFEQGRERIGPYMLLAPLGEGGFGDVYLAEQREPVARRVALKILKPGMDSREVVARFEQERHALALMDHPNIARVLDAGTTVLGRPYFVMELVIGPTLTAYCESRGLPMRARLELFREICNAVQHAHSKGVIHRDLKPSNVLVAEIDGRPVPKIIDFGIAKALDSADIAHGVFTQQRVLIGTPQYMSPEQADGGAAAVDTRADVYSLGVLLYELLTGTTPFDGERLRSAAIVEVARILREEEPPRPSTRMRSPVGGLHAAETRVIERELRGELDWIVMKAMEKERERRYFTASEFGADIGRYLSGEPVSAVPPSGLYLLRKAARRHRRYFVTAALVAGAIIGGSGLAVWQAVRATRAEREQTLATQRAERSASLASQREAEALAHEREAAAQAANFKAVNAFMQDGMLRMVMPRAALGREVSLLEVVDGVAARLDAGEVAQSPLVEAELRQSIGGIYHEIGRFAESDRHLSRAIDLRRTLRGPEAGEQLAIALNTRAVTLDALRRYAESATACEEALAILRKIGRDQGAFGFNVRANLATTLANGGDPSLAEQIIGEALHLASSGSVGDDRAMMRLQFALANALQVRGRYADAERAARQALSIRQTMQPPDPTREADCCHLLGIILSEQDKLNEARPILEQALSIRTRVLGEAHPDTCSSANAMGALLSKTGRHAEAEAIFNRVIEVRKASAAPASERDATVLRNLASAQLGQGKLDEAEVTLRRLLATALAGKGENKVETLRTLRTLGVVLQRKKNYTEAERCLEKARDGLREISGESSIPYAESLRDLGIVRIDLERANEAIADLSAALQIYTDNNLGESHAAATVIQSISKAHADIGNYKDSIDAADRGLELAPPDDPETVDLRARLLSQKGYALWKSGRPVPAETCFREVVDLRIAQFGENHAAVASALDSLAAQLEDQGRLEQAEVAARRALAIRTQLFTAASEPVFLSLNRIYSINMKARRFADALAAAREQIKSIDPLRTRTHPQPLSARVNLGDAAYAAALQLIDASRAAEALPILRDAESCLSELVELRQQMLKPDDWRLASHRVQLLRVRTLRLLSEPPASQNDTQLVDLCPQLETAFNLLAGTDPVQVPSAPPRAAQAAETLSRIADHRARAAPDDPELAKLAQRWRTISAEHPAR